MKDNNDINENVEPSFLDGLKKKGDFNTPPEFFDSFQKNVQEKIQEKNRSWFSLPQIRIASGAVLAAVVGAVIVLNLADSKTNELAFEDLADEDLVAYLDEHIDEVNLEEIVEELKETDVSGIIEDDETDDLILTSIIENEQKDTTKTKTVEEQEPKESIDDLTDEDIMEYLMEDGYEEGDWDEL